MSHPRIWFAPIVLNVMTMVGLGGALVSEGWIAKAVATAIMALPVGVACYRGLCGSLRGKGA